jgi:undecaprenyl-diphosphatase
MNSIIVFVAKDLIFLLLFVAAIIWFRASHQKKAELIALGLPGAIIAYIFAKIGGALYYDPRPFVSQHITPLFTHAADNGFPSDHMLLSSVIAVTFLKVAPKWGIVFSIAAILIGSARVAAHVHSPIDIVGAAIFATLGVYLAHWPGRYLLKLYNSNKRVKRIPTQQSTK